MDRAKLGDVEISVVISERPSHRVDVTEKSVEKGQDVADHVKVRPATLDLIGAVVGDDASDKLQKLKKYQKDGELVKYIHRTSYSNMVIEEIATTHDVKIRNGYEFNFRLKHVRIASAKEVEIAIVNPATKTPSPKTSSQVKPTTNGGMQQPKEKQVSIVTRQLSPQEKHDKFTSTYLQPGGTMKALVELYNTPSKQTAYRDPNIMRW